MNRMVKTTLFITVLLLSLIIFSVVGALLLKNVDAIGNFNKVVTQHRLYFAIWRYILMGIIVYFYPAIVRYFLTGKDGITTEKLAYYARRRHVVIMLLFIEIVVVNNGLSWLVNWLINL